MEFRGANAYDEENFFASFMKRREREDSPYNAIERPIIYELLGDFKNKNVLDLGCGDALFGKELLNKGAGFYEGVEGSKQMLSVANMITSGERALIHYNTMESFIYPIHKFDIITSRLAIHYVSDIHLLFKKVHKALKDDGKFVFSIQHPLTTSSFVSKESGDKRGNWLVDDYFVEGERKEPWMGQTVVKYHRTIEQYFNALAGAGFSITDLREGTPKLEHFADENEFERRLRIPIILAFSCKK